MGRAAAADADDRVDLILARNLRSALHQIIFRVGLRETLAIASWNDGILS